MELLFETRTNLHGFTGHLNFVQHKPAIHPEPVLVPDTFADRNGVHIYGSVLRDGGRYRMWYQAIPEDWAFDRDMAPVAYAESDDGMHWKKPKLGIVKHGPEDNNYTNFGMHCPSVFIDPHAPPSHRYRATGCGYKALMLVHPDATDQGYYTGHSADGLHWNLDSNKPTWPGADVSSSVWHPGQDRAIICVKHTPRRARILRRSIWQAELRDGKYSQPVSALIPDEFDDVCAAQRGYHSADYYGMGMLPAGMGTVGFLWHYWHELPYTGAPCGVGLYGTSDVTLVYQAGRGDRWLHFPGRPDFIPHNTHPWNSGWVNTASCPVEVGDEQWLYMAGTASSHGFYLDEKWQRSDKWADYAKAHMPCRIGVAKWPKWRLFGFDADPEGTFNIDLGVLEKPMELRLNYKVKPGGGRVRVEVPDAAGRSMDECVGLTKDGLSEVVAWKTGSKITPMPGKQVSVKLHVETATVYAYEVNALA